MEIIHLSHPYKSEQIPNGPVVMTLGFFDGVHLGHQKVIKRARKEADRRGIKLALMTFNQHPRIVYEDLNLDSFHYLTTNQRKSELMEQFNVDILYIVDYTFSFGTQTPQEFVEKYLVNLNTEVVVAGYDYTYGKKDVANMQTLPIHASNRFTVIEVDELSSHHTKVSTTRIKELIYNGEMNQANNDLGYIYEVYGTVIHGEKVGRTLGYPTANIQVPHPQLLPGIGVYAVEIKIGDTWHLGSASIGHNITFYENHDLTCEVYILDFNKMIYGEKVRVRWHHYLRGEYKFDKVDDLIDQLKLDEENTRDYFKQLSGAANV